MYRNVHGPIKYDNIKFYLNIGRGAQEEPGGLTRFELHERRYICR
jgi:hypothetical protein